MKIGLRVVRGPNWIWGNDDEAEGHVGTVINVHPDVGRVTVLWDKGNTSTYRAGEENAYDLYVFDNAQISVKHAAITCNECKEEGIKGIRWRCSVCHNYDLCSACYNQDKHNLSHSFNRHDTNSGRGSPVPPRQGSQKYQANGTFPTATVTRGLHWRWQNQDGGNGTHGFVMYIKDWETSFRSQAGVLWAVGDGYTYRLGHKGQVDLKCVKPASGGSYYKSHLPILGKMELEWQEERAEDSMVASVIARATLLQHLDSLSGSFDLSGLYASLEESVGQQTDYIKPGIRVVRGPDWQWADQDGGEGHLGTVKEVGSLEPSKPPHLCVSVVWDHGLINVYRIGRDNAFDLRVFDNAPSGIKHKNYECHGCKSKPIYGIRWKCASCFDVHLCSQCYNNNKHVTTHPFWRYGSPTNSRFKVPRRCDSVLYKSNGIFTSATVSRGPDWKWGDQDAGNIQIGLVLCIKPWDALETSNSAAEVLWANEKQNTYRVGHLGSMDLKCISATEGNPYYRDHLPILGKRQKTQCEFKVGNDVRCCFDIDLLKLLQNHHGGWTDEMEQYVHLNGKVIKIDSDDDVVVQYEDGKQWCYNQDALSKVDNLITYTRSPMDNDIVSQAMELGFEKVLVETVILKHFSEGRDNFASVEALVCEILDSQHQETTARPTGHFSSQSAVSENQRSDQISDSRFEEMIVVDIEVDSKVQCENQRLAEENRKLREARQCKICMDSDACVTFVPCGHLITCDRCSKTIKICPMCRASITSIIRTYIS